MKSLLLCVSFILVSSIALAQNPPNFVGTDCSGQSHDLFSELNQGKVIVVCWVMPCGVCTGAAKTSYNIVKSFQEQYPGRVLFYLADDYGNTNCTYVTSWANTQNLPTSEFSYRFSAQALKMMDYGSDGMPKVVIIGGADHKIYYNANNQVNSDQMVSAINTAIAQTTDVSANDELSQLPINVHPNPATNEVSLSFALGGTSDVRVDVVNAGGEIVKTLTTKAADAGPQQLKLDVASLPSGTYILRVHTREGTHVAKCVVSR